MATALAAAAPQETPVGLAERLLAALRESSEDRAADLVEALRSRLTKRQPRDPRSLFDLDDRLIDLMDRAEEAQETTGAVPEELIHEINDYIEAWRGKVDRIAGYWRWQESIAAICGKEAERLAARKKAAEGRVARLRNMLLAFMVSRGVKKLEGEKSSIGMQANSMASLMIDDESQISDCFLELRLKLNKSELLEIVGRLGDNPLQSRLRHLLLSRDWEVDRPAVLNELADGRPVPGAKLARGNHLRVR
ncbi:MAG: siphovirus Gp157 family protein [Bryobacteraceae bacterium]|nr:siphovirus Gp157 family protein [Bryobacteraceae bacterium]